MKFTVPIIVTTFGALILGPLINLSHYWNSNPLYGFAWFVPLMAAVLVYQRLEWLGQPKPVNNPLIVPAIFLMMLMWLPLRIVQVANPDWRVIDTLYLGSALTACLLLVARLYGWHWSRVLVFPAIFLLTALPWPIRLERLVTLQSLVSVGEVSRLILGYFHMPVFVTGYEIRTPYGMSHLSEACSGIRSFHLAVVGGLFLGAFFKLSLSRRIILLWACLFSAYVMNVVRVCLLVTILFNSKSAEVMNDWHDRMGWIMQAVFLAAMFLEAVALYYVFRRKETTQAERALTTPSAGAVLAATDGHLRVLAAITIIGFSIPLIAEGWYRWHERSSVMKQMDGWSLVDELPDPGIRELDMPLIVREQLPYEEGRYLLWSDNNGMIWQLIYMRFDGSTYSSFAHNIHQPETCLPSQNFTFKEKFDPLEMDMSDQHYTWQHQVYQREDLPLHLFFNKTATGPIHVDGENQDWSAKGRLQQAWRGIRIRNAQVMHLSAYAPYEPEVARSMAEQYLKAFIKESDANSEVVPAS